MEPMYSAQAAGLVARRLCSFLLIIGCAATSNVSPVANSEVEEVKATIKKYIGTFSNDVGADMWIWVAIVASCTFVVVMVLFVIGRVLHCVFCCGDDQGSPKRRQGRVDNSNGTEAANMNESGV